MFKICEPAAADPGRASKFHHHIMCSEDPSLASWRLFALPPPVWDGFGLLVCFAFCFPVLESRSEVQLEIQMEQAFF